MIAEFKSNGYIILRNAFSKELLEYTNSTWDKLKERPFADHFPTVKGEHISASNWELPFQYTNFGSAPFGHYLHISLQAMIEQKLGLELVPTYYFSREYFTDSVLYAHRDRPSCEISATIAIDYKSSAEKAWPIWVKNDPEFSKNKLTAFEVSQGLNQTERELQGCKAIYLEPGDAMIYQGCNVIHWRDPFEGDFSRRTFVHFVNKHGLIFKQFPEIEFDFRSSLSGSYADIEPDKRELMNRVNTLTSYANWSEENACKNL